MSEMTEYAPGTFCWVDYVAHDMEAAERWYADLFGWEVVHQDTQGGPPYAMFTKDGKVVAGIGQMSEEMKSAGAPPVWNDYVSVEDVAAIAKTVEALGGTVVVPPMQVMDSGSLAFFKDPSGAPFSVWQPGGHIGARLVNEPGSLSWNELNSPDPSASREFYGRLFGWSFTEAPMGAPGYVVIENGDRDNGGIMEMKGPQWEGIPPHWTTYFAVADCDAAAEKIEQTGGKVHVPPTDIPPGRFAVVEDPQGAAFTIIQLAVAPPD